MDEYDYWAFTLALLCFSGCLWLHRKMISDLQADVAFLRDVSRVTDAARNDV
jgi:hypothetical protein